MARPDAAELHLWELWRERRDVAARDRLVLQYSPWARMLARDVYLRVYLMRDAWSDCTQNALLGMLDAMDRFDPSVGAAFSTFARSRVRGAVFDGLRALTEGRHQGENAGLLQERMESLLDVEEGEGLLQSFVTATANLGLGLLMESQAIPSGASSGSSYYADLEKDSLLHSISHQMERLRERDRTILALHYYHQIPFGEIARRLQLTKGRVSQLHRRALDELRELVRGPEN